MTPPRQRRELTTWHQRQGVGLAAAHMTALTIDSGALHARSSDNPAWWASASDDDEAMS